MGRLWFESFLREGFGGGKGGERKFICSCGCGVSNVETIRWRVGGVDDRLDGLVSE